MSRLPRHLLLSERIRRLEADRRERERVARLRDQTAGRVFASAAGVLLGVLVFGLWRLLWR